MMLNSLHSALPIQSQYMGGATSVTFVGLIAHGSGDPAGTALHPRHQNLAEQADIPGCRDLSWDCDAVCSCTASAASMPTPPGALRMASAVVSHGLRTSWMAQQNHLARLGPAPVYALTAVP